MPNKVFISYRREDSQYQAGRIYEAFVRALPPDTVFMDVDSMAPGDDFVEALEGWVQQCDVLLALIGPNWLKSIDPRTNLRRLDNLEDFVRIEVRGALARKIPVVPVLLDAAKMPTADELPDDIKALTRRNAEFVDFRTFDADVQRLIRRLKLGKKPEQITPNPESPAGDNGDRKPGVSGPGVPAATSEPDRLKVPSLRVWPAVAASLAVILAILLAGRVLERWQPDVKDAQANAASDALKTSNAARQEAEARLAEALAAQAKAEQASKASEKRANDTADDLKKSEKTRLDAEARANDAADALKKSEKTRQEAQDKLAAAEAKVEELRKINVAKPTPAPLQPASQQPAISSQLPSASKLIADIGSKSRWTMGGVTNCRNSKDANFFSLEIGNDSIIWTNGVGSRDVETLLTSYVNAFYTDKRSYSGSSDSLYVQPHNQMAFFLARCP
jgi:hypothetical protein